jgi:2-dehydro-3-deoxygluconokinase
MKAVTFGEVMLRLATPGYLRFNQASVLEMTFGGGEANVAVSLALFGEEAAFVTRLPKNDVAETCLQKLRGLGVDTRGILRGGERVGIYFLESGASQRASTVTYDRAHSSIAEIDPAELNWDELLKGADWFHFTGITPALSDKAAQASLEGARAAKKLGLTVSCDLNFRKKLWSTEKAGKVMSGLMEHVDICIANEEDAEKVFGGKNRSQPIRGCRDEVDGAFPFQGRGNHLARELFGLAQRLVGALLHGRQGAFQPTL